LNISNNKDFINDEYVNNFEEKEKEKEKSNISYLFMNDNNINININRIILRYIKI